VSECLHCEIHELLDSKLQSEDANLVEIAAKVTEVLADLILMAPALEKKEDFDPGDPRRSRH